VQKNKEKIIVIFGPTAAGKSAIAVRLAKKFGGEVISADSRQVYKGLDIGTEKITKKEMSGIPHHLIDIVSPRKAFTAADFKKRAENSVRYIVQNGNVPIVVGGTGFYIDTLLGKEILPSVPPNALLRRELEKKDTDDLYKILKKKDPKRAKTIDRKNRRRLIRALEVIEVLGAVPQRVQKESSYTVLKIGVTLDDKTLRAKIDKRLMNTLKKGLVSETKKLRKLSLSWKRIDELGLEYRIVGQYLRGELNRDEMEERLKQKVWQYAKRQKTWLKKDKEIKWFKPQPEADPPLAETEIRKIEKVVQTFLQ
jgi:tRNA dimethylallyltransferase|tara:strand:+ start:3966 stop:4895 length:930 start_codon:yes stop_codon:yes gene_type:complete